LNRPGQSFELIIIKQNPARFIKWLFHTLCVLSLNLWFYRKLLDLLLPDASLQYLDQLWWNVKKEINKILILNLKLVPPPYLCGSKLLRNGATEEFNNVMVVVIYCLICLSCFCHL